MRYIILVLFIPMMLFGQYRDIPDVVTKVATSAGGFLKLETSARAIGMGGSFVASGRGVSGIPYNPSSIAYIEKNYPETAKEFQRIQFEQWETFCKKQIDYGFILF